jgi:hypothetical protein
VKENVYPGPCGREACVFTARVAEQVEAAILATRTGVPMKNLGVRISDLAAQANAALLDAQEQGVECVCSHAQFVRIADAVFSLDWIRVFRDLVALWKLPRLMWDELFFLRLDREALMMVEKAAAAGSLPALAILIGSSGGVREGTEREAELYAEFVDFPDEFFVVVSALAPRWKGSLGELLVSSGECFAVRD